MADQTVVSAAIVDEKSRRVLLAQRAGRYVVLLLRSEDPIDAAEELRRHADKIEAGIEYEQAGECDAAAVRADDGRENGEVAFAGRYFGVAYDGEEIRPPVALFANEHDAEAFAAGGVYENEDDKPSDYGIVFRADVCGLSWNGGGPDPIADDATGMGKRPRGF